MVSVKLKYLSESASMHVGHVFDAMYTHQLCLLDLGINFVIHNRSGCTWRIWIIYFSFSFLLKLVKSDIRYLFIILSFVHHFFNFESSEL